MGSTRMAFAIEIRCTSLDQGPALRLGSSTRRPLTWVLQGALRLAWRCRARQVVVGTPNGQCGHLGGLLGTDSRVAMALFAGLAHVRLAGDQFQPSGRVGQNHGMGSGSPSFTKHGFTSRLAEWLFRFCRWLGQLARGVAMKVPCHAFSSTLGHSLIECLLVVAMGAIFAASALDRKSTRLNSSHT